MKTIAVAGAHSGAGKTTVIEGLLKRLKGWSCLKVTVLHKGNCPAGRVCSGCENLSSRFCVVHDRRILLQKGKDTQRYIAAGAKKVLWLRTKPDGLEEGLRQAIGLLKGERGMIIEGTSVLKFIKPDLAVFVRNRGSILKPSAREIINKVDLVLTV